MKTSCKTRSFERKNVKLKDGRKVRFAYKGNKAMLNGPIGYSVQLDGGKVTFPHQEWRFNHFNSSGHLRKIFPPRGAYIEFQYDNYDPCQPGGDDIIRRVRKMKIRDGTDVPDGNWVLDYKRFFVAFDTTVTTPINKLEYGYYHELVGGKSWKDGCLTSRKLFDLSDNLLQSEEFDWKAILLSDSPV